MSSLDDDKASIPIYFPYEFKEQSMGTVHHCTESNEEQDIRIK